MQQLTSGETFGLMEAYASIYDSQETIEGQDLYESPPRSGLSNIPGSLGNAPYTRTAQNSPYNLQNLGASQYAAYKAGGGDAAMSKGSGTVSQIISKGRSNISGYGGGARRPTPVGGGNAGASIQPPTARPSTPAARPSTPAARTSTPAARPTAPAAKVTPPAATPATPASRTPNPLLKDFPKAPLEKRI
jgi:hypothetical protein